MYLHSLLTRLSLTLACTLILVACGARTDLPALPDVDTSRVLTDVKVQLEAARKIVESSPADTDNNGRYGLVLATYGRDEAADIAFRRARLLDPRKPRWAFYHAFVLRRMGKTEEALSAVNAGLQASPGQVDLLVKKGELLFDMAKFDEAKQLLGQALKINPNYPLAQYYQGRIFSQQGEFKLAIKEFEDMLSKGVQAYEVHVHMATALRATGDLKAANEQQQLADAKKRRTIAGYDPVVMKLNEFNKGDTPHVVKSAELFSAGKFQEAIDELLVAVQKNPDNINAHTHLIRLYGQQRKIEEAKIHYELARVADTATPLVYSNMGFAYQMDNQFDEAAKAYRTAIEQDPGNAGNYAELGYALLKTKQPEKAFEQFDKSLDIAPDNRDLRFIYGTTLARSNQLPQAVQMLNSALEPADLKGVMVRRTLAQVQLQSGNKQASIEHLEDALKIAESFQNEAMVKDLQGSLEKIKALPGVDQ